MDHTQERVENLLSLMTLEQKIAQLQRSFYDLLQDELGFEGITVSDYMSTYRPERIL